jgi:predicted CXXCH cytochrome family protein
MLPKIGVAFIWVLLQMVLGAGCGGEPRAPHLRHERSTPGVLVSNVERADYAGSEACASCHPQIAEAWARSPMHRMTRNAADAQVLATFNGAVLEFKGATVHAETNDGMRYLRIRREHGESLYRVTRVIGGRHREDFVGVAVDAVDPRSVGRGPELVMPVSFVFEPPEWRYKGYSVMVRERPYLGDPGPVWAETCIFCHNTVPLLTTLYDDLYGDGAPSYQGATRGNLLPAERRVELVVRDESGLGRAVERELLVLSMRPARDAHGEALLAAAIDTTRSRFRGEHLVEVGIGCEACHGGSRAHVDDPTIAPRYDLVSPYFDVVAPGESGSLSRAEAENRACARCHSVIFSRYPFTWEGRTRGRGPGGSNINSGEARDFLLGGCASAMRCSTCHDPHAEDDSARLAALATPAGNSICVRCHDDLAGDQALRAHAHHDPTGSGGACVACHMPRKNMSLGYGLTRYHRIGSPTDDSRVERDRPLECAICHADRSVGTLLDDIARLWGHRYDPRHIARLYGDALDVDPLRVTLERGKPHEQATAIVLMGERGNREDLPRLLSAMSHDYPIVRYLARESIARIVGARPSLDMNLPADELEAAARTWLHEANGVGESTSLAP